MSIFAMATILLIDGQGTTQGYGGDASILASALRVEGFDVLRATSANEARECLGEHAVDLVVLDLMLRTDERTSGLDFARELRERHPDTRVVLASSYYLSERQLERADCGASGFIPKPYDVAEVVRFIQSKLSSPPSSRRLWHAEPERAAIPIHPAFAGLAHAGARGRG